MASIRETWRPSVRQFRKLCEFLMGPLETPLPTHICPHCDKSYKLPPQWLKEFGHIGTSVCTLCRKSYDDNEAEEKSEQWVQQKIDEIFRDEPLPDSDY